MVQIIRSFLPLAIAITILSGTIYIAVQQNYRQSANDPQIQLAEDVANDLAHKRTPSIPEKTVEISESLSPYIIIFDKSGNQLQSNALLHGKAPKLPSGVLQSAQNQIETRFTWQPEVGIRQAVVLRYVAQKGYVLAGRSLREIENREEMLFGYVFFGWVTSLLSSFIMISLFAYHRKN